MVPSLLCTFVVHITFFHDSSLTPFILSLSLAFSFSFSLSLCLSLPLSLSLPFSETWGHLHSDIFGQFAPPRVSIVQKKLVDHNKSGSHDYIKHDQSIRALSEFDMLWDFPAHFQMKFPQFSRSFTLNVFLELSYPCLFHLPDQALAQDRFQLFATLKGVRNCVGHRWFHSWSKACMEHSQVEAFTRDMASDMLKQVHVEGVSCYLLMVMVLFWMLEQAPNAILTAHRLCDDG